MCNSLLLFGVCTQQVCHIVFVLEVINEIIHQLLHRLGLRSGFLHTHHTVARLLLRSTVSQSLSF